MNKYLIILNGCDDATYCELELTDEELKFLVKISKQINKYSTYQCEPSIGIFKDYKNLDGKRDFRISGNWDFKTRTYDWEAIDLVESKGESNE